MAGPVGRRGHHQCAAKHQINAHLMVKVWAYGVDVSLQSSLPMPRRSSHGSSWLSELPLTSVRWPSILGSSAKRNAALGQPHVQGTYTQVLGMGHGAPSGAPRDPRWPSRAKICSGPIARGPEPEVETLTLGSYSTI